MATNLSQRRRGLPRVRGGDPWPPEGNTAGEVIAAPLVTEVSIAAAVAAPAPVPVVSEPVAAAPAPAGAHTAPASEASEVQLRRGLPRVKGGELWPAAGTASVAAPAAAPTDAVETAEAAPVAAAPAAESASAAPIAATVAAENPVVVPTAIEAPVVAASAAKPAQAAPAKPAVTAVADKSTTRRGARIVLWLLGLIAAAGIVVLAARGLTTLPGVPEFVERYPGEYHLPEFVEPGFPAWVRWSHFLNLFFLVLIVRSGLLVRQQQKPSAYYTPKRGGKKVSIFLWLHTSLDVLWIANGIVFVVLLFATGHWARIVPTSWEVFPNALSAMLQYLTLEWPVENGWVNYNSLQQLMYFLVVFVAAPLAIVTGLRMSEWWPERATRLNRVYPAPLARAVHFPVMLFFVAFTLVHVFLVFATGMRRNLNHMFAGTDTTSWFGFWMLVIGIAVVAGAWLAARPLLLAPIASVSGKVSER